MHEFSFIHCADLHLGAGLKSRPLRSKYRDSDTCVQAFRSLIGEALARSVDLFLISGDVFDSDEPSVSVERAFNTEIERLISAHIHVCIISGNHDAELLSKLSESLSSEYLHILSSKSSSILSLQEMGVAVYGVNYDSGAHEASLNELLNLNPNHQLYKILLYHGDVCNPESGYGKVSIDSLRRLNVDYVALGHLHTSQILLEKPFIVYPGCIQGTSIKLTECGTKGAFFVRVAESRTQPEFLATSVIEYRSLDFNVFHDSRISKLVEQIETKLSAENLSHENIILRCSVDVSVHHDAEYLNQSKLDEVDQHLQKYCNKKLNIELLPTKWSIRRATHSELTTAIEKTADDLLRSDDLSEMLSNLGLSMREIEAPMKRLKGVPLDLEKDLLVQSVKQEIRRLLTRS